MTWRAGAWPGEAARVCREARHAAAESRSATWTEPLARAVRQALVFVAALLAPLALTALTAPCAWEIRRAAASSNLARPPGLGARPGMACAFGATT